MEIILKEEKKDTIGFSDELFESGIMVGIFSQDPVLITCGEFERKETLKALCLNEAVVTGNSYLGTQKNDMIGRIKAEIKSGGKFAWFPNDQWKEALQWLINNSK